MSNIEKPTCLYTYKPCTNPRSVKRNGSLHCFCDHHRRKANAIQKAHAAKKRIQQNISNGPRRMIADQLAVPAAAMQPIMRSPTVASSVPSFDAADLRFLHEWLVKTNALDEIDTNDGGDSEGSDLTAEDYKVLNELF
ncbi:hypothetical protein THRCLA_23132 [Thraustotheca clavata]|uniref:Uncharacterized protein n=1 Tax=Thraustotheca clavata TaxID=74557 RepID=A0A1V9YD77_9STRA|nr:hypothetical protein THRCLA_23132 [Thraustotheca clavata]